MIEPQKYFSEDELMAFVSGTASPDLSSRIDETQAREPALKAEIALMQSLKPALAGMPGMQDTPTELGWHRLQAAIRHEQHGVEQTSVTPRIALWRAAAVFFGVAALGQATYLAMSVDTPVAGYQTATEASEDHILVVSFGPDTSESAMRHLLQTTNARLVGGPGPSGLYRVAFDTNDALETGRVLLQDADIIELVLDD
jgi:hypothetical protein